MVIKKAVKIFIEWAVYVAVFILIVWGTPKGLTKILHTEYPIASITSSSMWPALKKGDLVFIKGVNSREEIEEGDIVVYRNSVIKQYDPSQTGFTIHRVVRKYQKTFVTKGDANNTEDEPVEYEKLVGKAVEWKDKPIRISQLGKLSQIFNK